MMTYSNFSDALDETLSIPEATTMKILEQFCVAIDNLFGNQYLRTPIDVDMVWI